jgi:hypothetical protein
MNGLARTVCRQPLPRSVAILLDEHLLHLFGSSGLGLGCGRPIMGFLSFACFR